MKVNPDITDLQKKIEQLELELFKERQRYQELLKDQEKVAREFLTDYEYSLNQAPVGVILVSMPNLEIKVFNSIAIEILGKENIPGAKYTFNDLFDSGWKFFHPDGSEWVKDDLPIIKTIKNREIFKNVEVYFVDKDGIAKWLLVSSAPIYNNTNNPIGTVLFFQDVTQNKLKDKAYEDSENKYRNVIEKSPMGIHTYTIDRQNRLIFAGGNPTADKLLGIKHNELIGKTIEDAFPALVETEVPSVYKRIATEGIQWNTEDIYYNDGKISGAYEVFAFQSSPGNVAVLFLEISARKISEQKLKDNEEKLRCQNEEFQVLNEEYLSQNEELSESLQKLNLLNNDLEKSKKNAEESDRLKSAFLANMSHEIRTPMNAIVGFADLLNQPDLQSSKTEQYVQIINSNSHQLLTIINDIIDISKIEAGSITISKSIIDVNGLMKEMYSMFLPLANKKTIELSVNYGLKDNESQFNLDDIRLKQLLNNLLSNAFKFTSSGAIQFGYTYSNNEMLFFVKDTGIGIPNDSFKHIFERFRQVESSSNRQYGGTGLGLAISKALVELMGGHIWLDSEIGKGSTFWFTIPIKDNDNILSPKTSDSKNLLKSWPGKTILIAEDEYHNYLLLEEIIKKTNINIIYAADGAEAVEKFKSRGDIDFIIMDIKMPVMDGYQALNVIKKIKPDIPVIAQTAFAMAEDKEKVLAAGFDYYITKPVLKEKLYSTINNILENK